MPFSLSSGPLTVNRVGVGTTAVLISEYYRRNQPFTISLRHHVGSGQIFLGNSSAVTALNGFPIGGSNVTFEFEVPAGVGILGGDSDQEVEIEELWAVSDTAGQAVAVFLPPLSPTVY